MVGSFHAAVEQEEPPLSLPDPGALSAVPSRWKMVTRTFGEPPIRRRALLFWDSEAGPPRVSQVQRSHHERLPPCFLALASLPETISSPFSLFCFLLLFLLLLREDNASLYIQRSRNQGRSPVQTQSIGSEACP